jgi:pimeloyl-ACP methyl ester carboxylesterase
MSSLHTEILGSGTPVVALHGFGPDHRLMRGMLEPVFERAPGYRRIYVDLPGCGRSPALGVGSTADVVQAVDELISEELGTERFLLAGESYGGYLSREIVRRRRAQVAGLALVCPVGAPLHADRRLPEHQVLVRDEAALEPLAADERAEFEPMAVVQSADAVAGFRRDIAPGLRAADQEALARIMEGGGYALPRAPEADGPFDAPCVIVTARQDSVVGYLDQWELLPHYPRATFAVLDAAGHNAQVERPDLVGELVLDWLARVAAHPEPA